MHFRLLLVVVVLICGFLAYAQTGELPSAPQMVASNRMSHDRPVIPTIAPEAALPPIPTFTASEWLAMTPPSAPPKPKLIDTKFIVLNALHFGLTVADVELTQRCMHAGTCRELNPTLPHSRVGMYAVNTATNAAITYFSYRRRKSGKFGWWIAPAIDVGAHAVGIGSNLRFAF